MFSLWKTPTQSVIMRQDILTGLEGIGSFDKQKAKRMTPAIQMQQVSRSFGKLIAVDNVSLEIPEGEIFGLLGPNGAGKTTILSILSTMLSPSSGSAMVNGHDTCTEPDDVRRSIGIVFQSQSIDEELSAWENMEYHARIFRVPREIRTRKINELLTLVELYDRRYDVLKKFSGGMKRRLELARGLLHHPSVLFLDEPTLGLDPQTRNHLWHYITTLSKEKGITIILTTHYMEEADRLCDRIGIIDHGRIIAIDTPDNLKSSLGGDLITIKSPLLNEVAQAIREPWINRVDVHQHEVIFSLMHAEQYVPIIMTRLIEKQIPITSLSIHKPTLEDVFLFYTGKKIRDSDVDFWENIQNRERMTGRA